MVVLENQTLSPAIALWQPTSIGVKQQAAPAKEVTGKFGSESEKHELATLMRELEQAGNHGDTRSANRVGEHLESLRWRVLFNQTLVLEGSHGLTASQQQTERKFINQQEAGKWLEAGEEAVRAEEIRWSLQEAVKHLWRLQPKSDADIDKDRAMERGLAQVLTAMEFMTHRPSLHLLVPDRKHISPVQRALFTLTSQGRSICLSIPADSDLLLIRAPAESMLRQSEWWGLLGPDLVKEASEDLPQDGRTCVIRIHGSWWPTNVRSIDRSHWRPLVLGSLKMSLQTAFKANFRPDTLPLSNLDFSGDASVYSGVRSSVRSCVGNDDAAGVGCRPAFG